MISPHLSMSIMVLTLAVFSFNQVIVNCDGEEAMETIPDSPMEPNEQQTGEQPPINEGETPANEASSPVKGNPPDLTMAASEDQTEISNEANTNGEDQPAMGADEPTSGDDGTTVNMDFEIPTEEPDKFGEELLATCKAEANYQGDFSDPNESSRELKCFYACALVRMDVMAEVDGQMNFSEQAADEIVTEALGDDLAMIEKYKSAITACLAEVPNGDDRCEYAYAFITCGIQKLSE